MYIYVCMLHVNMCVRVCMFLLAYVDMYMCMYAYMRLCVCATMCACVCVCVLVEGRKGCVLCVFCTKKDCTQILYNIFVPSHLHTLTLHIITPHSTPHSTLHSTPQSTLHSTPLSQLPHSHMQWPVDGVSGNQGNKTNTTIPSWQLHCGEQDSAD